LCFVLALGESSAGPDPSVRASPYEWASGAGLPSSQTHSKSAAANETPFQLNFKIHLVSY